MTSIVTGPTLWGRIRNYFLTGLLVLAPLVITGYVIWRVFVFVDHLLGTTLRGGYIRPGGVPGLGFVTVLVLIFIVGFLANNILGRQLGGLVESLLMRVPVLRAFYGTMKQVGEAILGDKRSVFQRVVLVEFPSSGRFALAFVTASPAVGVSQRDGGSLVAVFVPKVPNPTTGFLIFYPPEGLIPTSIRTDQAIQMIVSGGVVTPAMAAAARVEAGTGAPS